MEQEKNSVKLYVLICVLEYKIWKILGLFCIFFQNFCRNLFCFSFFSKNKKIFYCIKIKYGIFAKRNTEIYNYLYDDSLG